MSGVDIRLHLTADVLAACISAAQLEVRLDICVEPAVRGPPSARRAALKKQNPGLEAEIVQHSNAVTSARKEAAAAVPNIWAAKLQHVDIISDEAVAEAAECYLCTMKPVAESYSHVQVS
jgi:hypothetical protein